MSETTRNKIHVRKIFKNINMKLPNVNIFENINWPKTTIIWSNRFDLLFRAVPFAEQIIFKTFQPWIYIPSNFFPTWIITAPCSQLSWFFTILKIQLTFSSPQYKKKKNRSIDQLHKHLFCKNPPPFTLSQVIISKILQGR